MDRLVAVDGQQMDTSTHEQVVDAIRQSGNKCCLLVVDKDTDLMYAQVRSPPAIILGTPAQANGTVVTASI